jgi:hypothetical protein
MRHAAIPVAFQSLSDKDSQFLNQWKSCLDGDSSRLCWNSGRSPARRMSSFDLGYRRAADGDWAKQAGREQTVLRRASAVLLDGTEGVRQP